MMNENNDQNTKKCPRCGTLLTGRHCLRAGCGYSQTPEPAEGAQKVTSRSDPKALLVAALNHAWFGRTLREHPAVVIASSDITNWRPCKQSCTGTLRGLEHLGTLVPLVTDGTVAWFSGRVRRGADEAGDVAFGETLPETFVLHGHVASFMWDVPVGGRSSGAPPQPYSVEKPPTSGSKSMKKPRSAPARSALDAAMALLDELF